MESLGLRQYVHKYDFGMQDYYWLLRYQEEIKNLTDSEWRTKNPAEAYKTERKVREGVHTMAREFEAKQFRYLLRVTIQCKDGSLGKVEWNSH